MVRLAVLTQYRGVTDKRNDGQISFDSIIGALLMLTSR